MARAGRAQGLWRESKENHASTTTSSLPGPTTRSTPPMRALTFTGAAILTAAFLTGCGSESSPTAENLPGLTADAAEPNTADHFKTVEAVVFEVENPCNGEVIVFTGTAKSQVTYVDTRE